MAFPAFDTEIFLFFNGMHAPWADKFFMIVTNTWTWLPVYLAAIFFIFKKFKKKGFWVLLTVALVILCTDQTCNLVKRTVQRPRPSHTPELAENIQLVRQSNGEYYRGGHYSFPSGHAANTAAFALFLILFFREQRRWLIPTAIGWSLLLSYSRLYLGVHYPIDILCGWCVGVFWAALLSFLCLRFFIQNNQNQNP